MYRTSRSSIESGYVLVATILLGLAIAIASSTFLQYVVNSSAQMTDDTYTRLAAEAAEAGAVYAANCIALNGSNWDTVSGGLQSNIACDGTTKGSQNVSISTNGNYKWLTSFQAAPYVETDDNYQLSVTGTLTIMRGSSTIKTYTVTKTSLIAKYVIRASTSQAARNQATALSVDTHSCLIANGQLYCWGDNSKGQLGMASGDTTSRDKPTQVPFFVGKTVTKMAVGYQDTCAVASDATTSGKLYCWGDNSHGQVGNNTATTNYTTPQAVDMGGVDTSAATKQYITDLSLTQSTTTPGSACIIVDGLGYCWGRNDNKQIGLGGSSTTDVSRPTKLTTGDISGRTLLKISVGDIGGCAITSTVSTTTQQKYPMVCWGVRVPGQAAVGPTYVSGQAGHNMISDNVAVTGKSTCATMGAYFYGLVCYGQSKVLKGYGLVSGNPVYVDLSSPTAVTAYGFNGMATPFVMVNSLDSGIDGSDELYCVTAYYRPWCGGTANRGLQAGDPVDPLGNTNGIPFALLDVPTELNTRGDVNQGIFQALSNIWSGSNYGCFLSNGSLFCWGKNTNGQLGDGVATNTVYDSPHRIVQNNIGAQANQSTNTVADMNDFKWTVTPDGPISVGNHHACAIVDAYAMCWGANNSGQLGIGTTKSSYRPITSGVLINYGASKISAGGDSTCAVAAGQLFCWGDNTNGKLGLGSTTPTTRTKPTIVPFFSDSANQANYGMVTNVSVGATTTCAVTGYNNAALSGNTVFCWGQNNHKQVGNNTLSTADQPTPKQVTGLPTNGTVTAISVGASHACAIVNGDMYCWGTNGSYQLGYKTSTADQYPSIGKVNATGKFTAVSVGNNFTCGILNGVAVCWGANGSGQAGATISTNRIPGSLPITIGNSAVLTSPQTQLQATDIAAGDSHACAILQGATYCWGANDKGQLGNGDASGASVDGSTSPSRPIVAVSGGDMADGRVTIGIGAGNSTSCNVANGLISCWGNNADLEAGLDTTSQGQTAPDPNSKVLSPLTVQWYRYEAARNKGTFY